MSLDIVTQALVPLPVEQLDWAAAHQRFVELLVRLDVLKKQRQPWRCLMILLPALFDVLAERIEHPREIADQQVFFIQVVRIERGSADVGTVDDTGVRGGEALAAA